KFGLFATGFFHLLVQHYAIYVHIHLFNQVGSSKNWSSRGKAFAMILPKWTGKIDKPPVFQQNS
ncbi:MAG: hypothetical protein KAI80_01860, partial [Hyphomicrobiaceae bacterium]|nr:hypothetical protein [Hyphomicrobiaceae bacterium]